MQKCKESVVEYWQGATLFHQELYAQIGFPTQAGFFQPNNLVFFYSQNKNGEYVGLV